MVASSCSCCSVFCLQDAIEQLTLKTPQPPTPVLAEVAAQTPVLAEVAAQTQASRGVGLFPSSSGMWRTKAILVQVCPESFLGWHLKTGQMPERAFNLLASR